MLSGDLYFLELFHFWTVRSTGAHRRDAAWASAATASAAGEGHCTAVSRGWD